MQKSNLKKIATASIYMLFFMYLVFIYLISFDVIKPNNFFTLNKLIEKINNLISIILIFFYYLNQ